MNTDSEKILKSFSSLLKYSVKPKNQKNKPLCYPEKCYG